MCGTRSTVGSVVCDKMHLDIATPLPTWRRRLPESAVGEPYAMCAGCATTGPEYAVRQ